MQKGRIKNMYPGGNTCRGFFSYYEYIIREEDANRVFILKGGPGTGKSTFMRKTAEEMSNRGYNVELMHCSSDIESLDGVAIPQAGIALIDGTAPHVTDPANPGFTDEIINLGEFWNEREMRKNREKAIEIKNEIRSCFTSAYGYLKAAMHIYENSAAICGQAMDAAKAGKIAEELCEAMFCGIGPADKPGCQRRLFAGAITPGGLRNFLDELTAVDNVYLLEGFPGAGTEKVVGRVMAKALERGFDVEAFYCGFDPGKLEHLVIPALNTTISTVNKYHTTDACALRRVDFMEMLNGARIERRRRELENNEQLFDGLLGEAVSVIRAAKTLHDELESLYIPFMDFDAIHKKWESVMEKILNYAGESHK